MTASTVLLVTTSYDLVPEYVGTIWGALLDSAPSIDGSKKPELRPSDTKEGISMSANAPFLAKFAKAPSKDEAKSNSNPGTISTRVARETTDDR